MAPAGPPLLIRWSQRLRKFADSFFAWNRWKSEVDLQVVGSDPLHPYTTEIGGDIHALYINLYNHTIAGEP